MKAIILLVGILCSVYCYSEDCAVLLHGLGRSSYSMLSIQNALNKSGFKVINDSYPSRNGGIEHLSLKAIEHGIEQCHVNADIYFVTHSMGGILLRYYLKQNTITNLQKVVMLAPPNQGSKLADIYSDIKLVNILGGPALSQLSIKDEKSLPKQLGRVSFELGIIAGDRTINPILSLILPGADDGKVAVKSTVVEGMTDHIVLHTTHPFMTFNPLVVEATLNFFQKGYF